MTTLNNEPSDTQPQTCPFPHGDSAKSEKKLVRVDMPSNDSARVERDDKGVWQVRGFDEVRTILRHSDTTQAGFSAELITKTPSLVNLPILFQDGQAHQQQRKQTAKFFTPKAVSNNYWDMMEKLADRLMVKLQNSETVQLDRLSLDMAVEVAGRVVGLTNSILPGMSKRLERFFESTVPGEPKNLLDTVKVIISQWPTLKFYLLDVKPAIIAHKRKPQEDVISHLIGLNYKDREILIECITYAAAGMITTREFISAATWHFMERPELRERYLAAPTEERQDILQEILRLEPIVNNLFRRASADIELKSADGETHTIHSGELINLDVFTANIDKDVVGEDPEQLCPGRKLREPSIQPAVESFGDGAHRCPGIYIALQETDIFLQRLLAQKNLHIVKQPTVTWHPLVTGYEIRDFVISVK